MNTDKNKQRVLLFVCVYLCASVVSQAGDVTALRHVTVISGLGTAPQSDFDVIVDGARIAAVAPHGLIKLPAQARVMDLPGCYVIPGLIDMHAHVTFLRPSDRGASEQVLKTLLDFGITTVRNPSAPAREGVALREDVRAGRIIGPRIFTSGEAINIGTVGSEAEVRAEVARQAAAGVDFIKLYAGLPPELVRAGISEAHRRKLPVVGHLQETDWTQAAQAGIDFVTHGAPWSASLLPAALRDTYRRRISRQGAMKARIFWLEKVDLDGPQVREMIRTMAQHGVSVDPTLVAYESKFKRNSPKYAGSLDLQYASEAMRANWTDGGATADWTDADFRRMDAAWPKMLRLTRMLHHGGVMLTAGSDLPNLFVVPGVSLHQELELLVQAGLPPLEVLKIATHNAAKALGILNETGAVEAGKLADLVVLSADPLSDIRNTRKIKLVMTKGRLATANSPSQP
jgi:imidazolonepropionase-like amidohydrolase